MFWLKVDLGVMVLIRVKEPERMYYRNASSVYCRGTTIFVSQCNNVQPYSVVVVNRGTST